MENYPQQPLIHTTEKIWDIHLIQVFPIARITTIISVVFPENFKATNSLIREHSAPESK